MDISENCAVNFYTARCTITLSVVSQTRSVNWCLADG